MADALQFAQEELAPRGEENPAFLAELERTMALLAFDLPRALPPSSAPVPAPAAPAAPSSKRAKEKAKADDGAADAWSATSVPPNLVTLLHPSHRAKTAHELNSAILTSQSYSPSPKLPGLIRMMAWGEDMLADRADFPRIGLQSLLGASASVPIRLTRTAGLAPGSQSAGGDEAADVAMVDA